MMQGMGVFGLILLIVALIAAVAIVVVGGIALVVLVVLVLWGILSTSIFVAISKRSVGAGFRTMLTLLGAAVTAPLAAGGTWLTLNLMNDLQNEVWGTLAGALAGLLVGALAGYGLAVFIQRTSQRMAAWVNERVTRTKHVEAKVRVPQSQERD